MPEETCDTCNSTRISLQDDGRYYCHRGHMQTDRIEVVNDEFTAGSQGKRHSTKKKKLKEKVRKSFQGREALRLFLQIYQLILWKQCHALIHVKKLPAELETVVRDLWTLRLEQVQKRAQRLAIDDDASTVYSSQGEESSAAASSADNDDYETDAADESVSEYARSIRRPDETPRLIDTIALCYAATLLMRLPVTIGEMYAWVMSEEVPFIMVMRHVPKDMMKRLPGEYFSALKTKNFLQGDELHRAVHSLMLLYKDQFGISWPPINTPLVLFKAIQELALPLELHAAALRLQRVLTLSNEYPTPVRTKRKRVRLSSYPEPQLIALLAAVTKLYYPLDTEQDVRRYPRSLEEPAIEAIDWSEWTARRKEKESADRVKRSGPRNEEMLVVKEADVFDMDGDKIDEYLDWYEGMWIDKGHQAKDSLLAMFPTGRIGASSTSETMATNTSVPYFASSPPPSSAPELPLPLAKEEVLSRNILDQSLQTHIRDTISSTRLRRPRASPPPPDETELKGQPPRKIPRPGSNYTRLHPSTDPSTLPASTHMFLTACARLAGLDLSSFMAVLYQVEAKVAEYALERRRRRNWDMESSEASTQEEDSGLEDQAHGASKRDSLVRAAEEDRMDVD